MKELRWSCNRIWSLKNELKFNSFRSFYEWKRSLFHVYCCRTSFIIYWRIKKNITQADDSLEQTSVLAQGIDDGYEEMMVVWWWLQQVLILDQKPLCLTVSSESENGTSKCENSSSECDELLNRKWFLLIRMWRSRLYISESDEVSDE